jgi:L-aspartate oxidase
MDQEQLKKLDQYYCDFLVIGSGLAGLYAALYASKFGKVALITKSTVEESNSYWAQGGIAAAIDPEDSPLFHLEDTITAGRGLCNRDAVEILVREGKERVMDLINFGMKFDMDEKGLELGLEGGHTKRRVLHAGGSSTGKEMVRFLTHSVKASPDIFLFERMTIAELISHNERCHGALAFKDNSDQHIIFVSKSTILATGGASALYQRTTNPPSATGDGIALSYRAGAEIMDMEFVQFHPTALHIEDKEGFLISEAVRGEGAYLLNHSGHRFMPGYHELAELAPRDVVSRSIFEEMRKSGKNYVFLDLRHLAPDFVKKRFSNIYDVCLKSGIDITKDLVPVSPAAHYTVGGVKTGLMAETNVKGLFACGEVACSGVHGANRLASNSLLECIVFAKRAIDGAIEDNKGNLKSYKLGFINSDLMLPSPPSQREAFLAKKNNISRLMTKHVEIVRSADGLEKACDELERISESINELSGNYKLKIQNMIDVSLLITKSALIRKESRGAHVRQDFPAEDPRWKAHIIWKKGHEPAIIAV